MISRLRFRRLLGGPALYGDVHARVVGPPAVGAQDAPSAPESDTGGCTCTGTCECTPGSTAGR